ncbi:uncharacterized protein LOC112591177 [Melanaphis sacchari]|uniref:uncharacterized protein LOC112591177 n=1 Tax=Melanaphis sacchari TaxID=742174 RepID=UPI000DC13C49|nr:uncharacterized protein LOC112591177 [Melanaphis sacchari]
MSNTKGDEKLVKMNGDEITPKSPGSPEIDSTDEKTYQSTVESNSYKATIIKTDVDSDENDNTDLMSKTKGDKKLVIMNGDKSLPKSPGSPAIDSSDEKTYQSTVESKSYKSTIIKTDVDSDENDDTDIMSKTKGDDNIVIMNGDKISSKSLGYLDNDSSEEKTYQSLVESNSYKSTTIKAELGSDENDNTDIMSKTNVDNQLFIINGDDISPKPFGSFEVDNSDENVYQSTVVSKSFKSTKIKTDQASDEFDNADITSGINLRMN